MHEALCAMADVIMSKTLYLQEVYLLEERLELYATNPHVGVEQILRGYSLRADSEDRND